MLYYLIFLLHGGFNALILVKMNSMYYCFDNVSFSGTFLDN